MVDHQKTNLKKCNTIFPYFERKEKEYFENQVQSDIVKF